MMRFDWQNRMQKLTLEELGTKYNELSEQIKASSEIDIPYMPEQLSLWLELQIKQAFIFGIICERAHHENK